MCANLDYIQLFIERTEVINEYKASYKTAFAKSDFSRLHIYLTLYVIGASGKTEELKRNLKE